MTVKAKVYIISIITVVLAVVFTAAFCFLSNTKNVQVDNAASEASLYINLDRVQNDMDENTAFANFCELNVYKQLVLYKPGLTYFDGSTNKYDELMENFRTVYNEYENYFLSHNQQIYQNSTVDFSLANKSQLDAAIARLEDFSKEIEFDINDADWSDKEAFTFLLGDNAADAKRHYAQYKYAVDNRLAELKCIAALKLS